MQKKTLFIHIGTHKTGSTAIQETLIYNKKIDAKYIEPNDAFMSIYNSTGNEGLNLNKSKAFEDMLLSNINNKYSKYIISEEEFSGSVFKGYKDSVNIAKRLRLATAGIFKEIKIIIYIRSQDEWIQSMYTQQIHQGRSWSFEEFINKIEVDVLDWGRVISSYESEFKRENIIIKRYDKYLLPEQDSLLKEFFDIVGINFNKLIIPKKSYSANSGYNSEALEFARLVNQGLNSQEKQTLRHELQRISSKNPHESYTFWPAKDRDNFISKHKKCNDNILDKYFYNNTKTLFSIKDYSQQQGVKKIDHNDMLILLTRMHLNHKTERLYFINVIAFIENKVITIFNKFPSLKSKVRKRLLKYI